MKRTQSRESPQVHVVDGTVSLGDMRPDPKNARRHTPRNVGVIESALREVGAARSIVIDEKNVVLAGNATIEAAAQAGIEKVQVVDADGETIIAVRRSGLTDKQKARLALYDNRAAELAEWDVGVLEMLQNEVGLEGLFTDDELADLVAQDTGPREIVDAEPQLDRAEELRKEWGTGPGQLWRLGDHRLRCGDATSSEDIERLMAGERYSLLVTDPPYGVSYSDKNAFLNAADKGNRVQKPIVGDHLSPEGMSELWKKAFTAIRPFAEPGASYYVTGPQGGDLLVHLLLALRDSGFPLRHMLVWAKNNHVLGRCDYHYKHEPIIYGWVEGAGHLFLGTSSETSLWEIDRPQKSELHPTMKPVELYARAIRNSSRKGAVVADFFAGSGTAVMACETEARRAFCMEQDPGYVAVILQRWTDATARKPELVEESKEGREDHHG